MQNRITKTGSLLNNKGELIQKGWASDLILDYNRNMIKAPAFKIKEWDYYCVLSSERGASFTIADNGYLGFIGATIFDFSKPEEISNSIIIPFPMGSLELPKTSITGDVQFKDKRIKIEFLKRDHLRTLNIFFKNFSNGHDLEGSLVLHKPEDMETMVIATPFAENHHAFYYNQKINCMSAEGQLICGKDTLQFNIDNSFGILDWGRGVWTYSNTWFWGSASGIINQRPFGFNIGYGFGDTSAATENMIFYDGKVHKLEKIEFHIPKNSFLGPWKFTSSDGRLEMDFTPIIDRHSNTNLLIIKSDQHQVFGHFSGKAVLDNGTILEIKDLMGFAEEVKNRW